MEDWARRGMERWPNVPAVFGWLSLDRRGRWRIQGELISRPQIIETFNRNYEADAQGRWFFQNGPQRGYVALETAPLVLHPDGDRLRTHHGLVVEKPTSAWIDEDGGLWLSTEHGPAALADNESDWLLQHLSVANQPVDEDALASALALPAGAISALRLSLNDLLLPVQRVLRSQAAAQLGFVADPQPQPGEKSSERAPD